MEIKKHYKMFKNGKQWAYAAVATVAIALGTMAATTQSGQADTINTSASNTTATQTYDGRGYAPTNYAASTATTQQQQATTNSYNVQSQGTPASYDQGNYGYVDNVSVADGKLDVSGWNASNQDVNKPYHFIILYDQTQGHELTRQQVTNTARPDVAQQYSNVYNAGNSGYSTTFNVTPSVLQDQLQLISRYSDASNGEGNHVDLWYGPFTFAKENKQGALTSIKSNGSSVTVNGYDEDNNSLGKNYHYLILFDKTTQQQLDSQRVYTTKTNGPVDKNIYNAANAGFNATLHYNGANAGDQLSIVSRYSTSAEGNGDDGNPADYTDMWFNFSTNNNAWLDSFDISDGDTKVSGWNANDRSAFAPYHFLIIYDNTGKQQVAQTMVNNTTRNDVAQAYPQYLTGAQSGFSANFGKLNYVAGHNYSLVSRYSTSSQGNGGQGTYSDNWMSLGTLNANESWVDAKNQNGDSLHVAGWMASDSSAAKPYAYAIVLENGQEVGRTRLDLTSRDDVAKAYKSVYNSDHSGFNVNVPVGHNLNGMVELVLRFTDDPAGNGNATDQDYTWYFNNGSLATNTTVTCNGTKYKADGNGNLTKTDTWCWPFPGTSYGNFSGAQLFGVNPGGSFRINGYHDGLDFGSVDHPGTDVHAVHEGTVTRVGYTAGLEWYVTIEDNNYLYCYQEAFSSRNQIAVSVGQHVDAGQVIGYRNTSHLHLGISANHNFNYDLGKAFTNDGTWLNPLTILTQGIANN